MKRGLLGTVGSRAKQLAYRLLTGIAIVSLGPLACAAPSEQAGTPDEGLHSFWEDEMDRPVPESSLPSFEELRGRILKLFTEAPFAWTDVHPELNPVSVDLLPSGRDKEAWRLLVAGVKNSQPGLAVTEPGDIGLQIGFSMGDGSYENRPVSYADGVLYSGWRYFGGKIRTLKVGPEFEQGLRMLEEVPEIEFEWPPPPEDEDPAAARAAAVSRSKAVDIARRFAATTGLPLGDSPVAVYRQAEAPYPPRWEVRNHQFALVAVAADDGTVTLGENGSAREENWHLTGQVEMTEEQARERAEATLWAMGATPSEVKLREVDLRRTEGRDRAVWWVIWDRVTDGIPYNYDSAYVLMDATTGTVYYATKRWFSAPPATTDAKIDKESARQIALGLSDVIGAREITRIEAEPTLRIVQPNDYYPSPAKALAMQYEGATRVVWEVVALVPPARPGGREGKKTLWIDAVTGELLGGYGTHGGAGRGIGQAPPAGKPGRSSTPATGSSIPATVALGGAGLAALAVGIVRLSRSRAARKRGGAS